MIGGWRWRRSCQSCSRFCTKLYQTEQGQPELARVSQREILASPGKIESPGFF